MHIIRLRRPWSRTAVDSSGNEQTEAKTDVPDLELAAVSDRRIYQRSFNRPTGLNDQSQVFLAISDWQGRLQSMKINQSSVELVEPPTSPLRIDVTPQLELSNKIEIQIIKEGDQQPLLCGSVQIEIED